MGYSEAGGKLIDEKNQKQKISWHCPFKNCYAKSLLIYLLVLRCNIFHPNFGFLLQCLLLIPQNRAAVQWTLHVIILRKQGILNDL
jgi:hypothetical protein